MNHTRYSVVCGATGLFVLVHMGACSREPRAAPDTSWDAGATAMPPIISIAASNTTGDPPAELAALLVSPLTPRWDRACLETYLDCMGEYKRTRSFDKLLDYVIAAATTASMRVPTNALDFARLLYDVPATTNLAYPISLLRSVTNEALAELLLWGMTNYFAEWHDLLPTLPRMEPRYHHSVITNSHGKAVGQSAELQNPDDIAWTQFLSSRVQQKCDYSFFGLRSIGTPRVVHALNCLLNTYRYRGEKISDPTATIAPDKYPEEARRWLLTSPFLHTKNAMAAAWYTSHRPEAPEVLRLYIAQLKHMPVQNDQWFIFRDPEAAEIKRHEIWRLTTITDEYERMYKRWLADGKRMPLHYGCYHDENWRDYKKRSPAERKARYGTTYREEGYE